MISYYKTEFSSGTVRYFAVVSEPELGIQAYTEWRLDGDDATAWIELPTCPVMGWLVNGETSLDEINAVDVPVPLTLDTTAAAA